MKALTKLDSKFSVLDYFGLDVVVNNIDMNWLAIDKNGDLFAYLTKPSIKSDSIAWNSYNATLYIGSVDLEDDKWEGTLLRISILPYKVVI